MNIFSYESKVSQILMFVADLCILNVLFVICCLPVFTIGAAQAALYSGIRTLIDPENDEAPRKAFFRAFRTGFLSITGAWGIFALVEAAMLVVFYFVVGFGQTQPGAPVWMCLAALIIMLLLQSQIPLFHARFTCTVGQLLRNCFMMVFAHPLRSILVMVLIWAPVVLFLLDVYLYVMIAPVWLLLYYSVAFMLSFYIMKKPFNALIEHYNQTHDAAGNAIPMTLDEEGNLVPAMINEDGTLSPAPAPEESAEEAVEV